MNENQHHAPARPVVGRFAPSPSGRMHLGNAFSALMAWLGARSQGGRMVLRIEDLDPRASNPALAEQLIADLAWLGLDWDEGPYYQSERTHIYEEALRQLESLGLTYPCFCTRAELHAASAPHASDGTTLYAGTCRRLTAEEIAEKSKLRRPATRLVIPDKDDPAGTIEFDDLVYGRQLEQLASECGDFLVRRSDGVFAYQLVTPLDDALMGVTQVVRGRDLLGSVARQSYLLHLLGHTPPTYAHVPLLVAPDGRRLSKRDRDLDLGALQAAHVSPQRIVGTLAHAIGLAEPDEELAPASLIDRFSWNTLAQHQADITIDASTLTSS